MKWILGLDRTTPNYVLEEEVKLKSIRIEAAKRAIRYEEKMRKSEKEVVKLCLQEREREWGDGRKGKWAQMKADLMERFGYNKERIDMSRINEDNIEWNVTRRMIDKEREQCRVKVKDSKYNREYQIIMTEKEPTYLEKRMKSEDRKIIARYRCGNEVKAKMY